MTRLRLKLLSVGSEWVTVRVGASRSYVFKIRQRYPEFEWQAELITAQGPGEGSWRVMARRR